MQDTVIRNFEITLFYFHIGHSMQDFLGIAGNNSKSFSAVWPTLATWASNSAGISIRKQVPPNFVTRILKSVPEPLRSILKVLGPEAVQFFFNDILSQTSASLAVGNLQVFESVGGCFARFGQFYSNLTGPSIATNLAFNNSFTNSDLDQTLKVAMQFQYRALWTNDIPTKAQFVFAANMLVGLAEQAYLQKPIEGSFPGNLTFSLDGFNFTIDPAPIITQVMISLVMAREVLNTGEDVPPRFWDNERLWPSSLQTLIPEVADFYLTFVPQINSMNGTAAKNWIWLSDRLKYIVPVFRSRADDVTMYSCPPFTPAQIALIKKGIRPAEDTICLAGNCCQNARYFSKSLV